VLEKLVEIKMIDIWIPTVGQHRLILPRHAQPAVDTSLSIEKPILQLQSQPPSRPIAQRQSYKLEVQTSTSGVVCGKGHSQARPDSEVLNRLKGAYWESSASLDERGYGYNIQTRLDRKEVRDGDG
jgi:hypothetical protein